MRECKGERRNYGGRDHGASESEQQVEMAKFLGDMREMIKKLAPHVVFSKKFQRWLETLERKKQNYVNNANYNLINLSNHLNVRHFNPKVIVRLGRVRKGSEHLGRGFNYELQHYEQSRERQP